MLIFVYEFLTGGGLFESETWPPPASLLAEGRAMVRAVASDFASIRGIRVVVLQDDRLSDLQLGEGCVVRRVSSVAEAAAAFCESAREADWSVVIAPELDDYLAGCCQRVLDCGGRLLGPSLGIVKLAADKQATAEHLAHCGAAVPMGQSLPRGDLRGVDLIDCFPAVLKPLQGAGSQDVHLVPSREAMPRCLDHPSRLERFCPGQPVSVAVLCGPRSNLVLPACSQRISHDGAFTYLGGSLPLSDSLAKRAERLAQEVIALLPQPLGYLGVDMILGPAADGSVAKNPDDVVIEINPRLTTSYVGLRAMTTNNLAAAMLRVAQGVPFELSWHDRTIRFTPSGQVSWCS